MIDIQKHVNEKELYRLTTSYEIPYDAFDKYG